MTSWGSALRVHRASDERGKKRSWTLAQLQNYIRAVAPKIPVTRDQETRGKISGFSDG